MPRQDHKLVERPIVKYGNIATASDLSCHRVLLLHSESGGKRRSEADLRAEPPVSGADKNFGQRITLSGGEQSDKLRGVVRVNPHVLRRQIAGEKL